jgi:cytidyltransferase-like protein
VRDAPIAADWNAMNVVVIDSLDNLKSRHVRLLHEAASLGPLHVLLWSDKAVQTLTGRQPEFSETERLYFVQAIRYVHRVSLLNDPRDVASVAVGATDTPALLVVDEAMNSLYGHLRNGTERLDCRVVPENVLTTFPDDVPDRLATPSSRKKVIVTGCYDWLHTGHVRFFEEVAHLGDLYVVVGHDANIRLLKGEGHPMFSAAERRYMVGSIRHVTQALVATGHGWLDAEPEIERIKPDIYAVNEDGDRPEKRSYCQARGIEYRVLKRTPKEGLPPRQSTVLRGCELVRSADL